MCVFAPAYVVVAYVSFRQVYFAYRYISMARKVRIIAVMAASLHAQVYQGSVLLESEPIVITLNYLNCNRASRRSKHR